MAGNRLLDMFSPEVQDAQGNLLAKYLGTGSGLRRSVIDDVTGKPVITSAPTGDVVQRSSLFPVGVTDEGRLTPAIPGALMDAYHAAQFPGQVYRGEKDVFDPATGHVSQEAMDAANGIASMAMMGGLGGAAAEGGTMLGAGPIRAYHGSPHDFDAFSMSKIGTGEGAQAYGHGLYFAGNEDVARIYRDALSPKLYSHPDFGAGLTEADVSHQLSGAGQTLGMRPGSLLDDTVRDAVNRLPADRRGQLDYLIANESHPQARQLLEQARGYSPDRAGRMYEVAIDADPAKMLDWDKPLFEQHPMVREIMRANGYGEPSTSMRREAITIGKTAGLTDLKNPAEVARLAADGIPGIRYLDGGSRGIGEGSHNYVTFSDDIVNILRKYGLAGMIGGGAAAAGMMQPGEAKANALQPFLAPAAQ